MWIGRPWLVERSGAVRASVCRCLRLSAPRTSSYEPTFKLPEARLHRNLITHDTRSAGALSSWNERGLYAVAGPVLHINVRKSRHV